MLGTAPPQALVLLVHQPGPWGPRGLLDSRCDPEVAQRIDVAAAAAGMRLQAIRRPGKHEVGRPAGGHNVAIADTRAAAAAISWRRVNDLADLADDLERGVPPRAPVEIDTAPLYLVCAHGRHDACCALRGRPVTQALERVRPGRVWETTHLGGDRFAANLLVLPHGELYGRVPATLAHEMADRIDAGEVVAEIMRGRIGLTPIAQAALVYAHNRLGIPRRDALTVMSVESRGADRADAKVATPVGPVVVTVAIEMTSRTQLTCRGPQGARAREYRGIAISEPVRGPANSDTT
jgi:hypothetical protein